jgi:hypothetical protein
MRSFAKSVLFLVLSLVVGCYHAGAPSRTAETAPAGKFRFRETWNVFSAGQGTVSFEDGQTLTGDVNGEEPSMNALGWSVGMLASVLVGARVGLTDRLELGAELGMVSSGLELRYGLLDEDAGDPFSLAISAMGFYRPLRDRPGGRVGVDLSRRFGTTVPFVGAYATHGAETYVIAVPRSIDEGPPEWLGPYVRYSRDETRLVVPIGVEWRGRTVATSFSIVPYLTLQRGDAYESECSGCEQMHPIASFENEIGATAVLQIETL